MRFVTAAAVVATLALTSSALAFGNGYGMRQGFWGQGQSGQSMGGGGHGRWMMQQQAGATTQTGAQLAAPRQTWGPGGGRGRGMGQGMGQGIGLGMGLGMAPSTTQGGPAAEASQPAAQPGFGRGNRTGDPVFVGSWDGDEDGVVTLKEAQERRGDYFDSLDENEDGVIVAAEFTEFLNNTRMPPAEATNGQRGLFGMTLDFNDANRDGKVDREEFLAQTARWLNGMDRNGDGKVSNDDFGPRQAQMGRGMGRGMGTRWMQQQS
ncbi:hypothetical protein [Cohaesibacter haloalkalitolerans]|uniref:hypothetical protein n=1 Tax=Cohaesibacter haloalkalitolerans TaxID=1162980 RepID=UPI0013C468AC|nr:hypothetical protein [Cohaesibacter haloalkalitolerans]